MCGIIGYSGNQQAWPILLEGLTRLEYRGYDSAGIAVFENGDIAISRAVGKIARLRDQVQADPPAGDCGIGHTRWATHGPPAEENAHPHRSGDVVVVHNGILENHAELKRTLQKRGRRFVSQTDTEVFAHLIDIEHRRHPLPRAVARVLRRTHGSYALVVMSSREPGRLVAARMSSPLVVGYGKGENFVASDVPALLPYTRQVAFCEDGDVVVLEPRRVQWFDLQLHPQRRRQQHVDWSPLLAEKGGHKHFMHKEIHEQPRALADTLAGRLRLARADVDLDDAGIADNEARKISRAVLVACGTSWHAALVGKFLLERLARLPAEVDLASEFRYRPPLVGKNDLIVAISQSGETADTLAAVRQAGKLGSRVLAVCNVLGSSLSRAADHTLYTHAGPEIGVASTKAFVTQLAALLLVAVRLGRARGTLQRRQAAEQLAALSKVPTLVEQTLKLEPRIKSLAERFAHARDFLYLGRGINFPIALEGALKLKEISYIHAEGYPAGEMKHGPIALIDEQVPVVAVATRNSVYEKVLGNLAEVRARRGTVIAVCSQRDRAMGRVAEHLLPVPRTSECTEAIVNVVPLQLLAYHVADFNGTDVDQPRNLAKSVTVE